MSRIIKHIPLLITILLTISCTFLISQNIGRSLVSIVLIWVWYGLGRYFKSFFFSSIILLILIFPFNITLNIYGLVSPYVNGVITNYLIPHLSVLDLFSAILIISAVLEHKKLKVGKLVLLLFGLLLLSSLVHVNIVSLFQALRFVLYAITILFIYSNLEEVWKRKNILTKALLLSIAIQLAFATYQFFSSSVAGLPWLGESALVSGAIGSSFVSFLGTQFLRAYGTFPHPNVLAGFLLFALFFSSFLPKGQCRNILFVLAFLTLLLTISRLHIALASGLLVLLFMQKSLFAVFPISFLNSPSVVERINLSRVSLEYISDNPWGVGQNMFVQIFQENVVRTSNGLLLLQPVHNIFLLLFVEHGWIIGGGLILVILVLMLKKYLRLNLLFLYILFCIIIIGMFDHYFLTQPQGIFMFLLGVL